MGTAGAAAIIATGLPLVGAAVALAYTPRIVAWFHGQGAMGVLVFIAAYILCCGLALLPTYVCTILGGWIFKFTVGFPATMVGVAGAAMIGYTLAHRIVGHRVRRVIHEHPRWEIVRNALVGGKPLKVIGVITLLRLSPLLPFETTNVLLASCEVRRLPFLIGTLIGVTPRTAAAVFIASRAHHLDFRSPGASWLLIVGMLATVAIVIFIGVVAKRALERQYAVTASPQPPVPSDS
jgi:uncharacterized membrane protein YdjX (TVP38/TMEM64 family)